MPTTYPNLIGGESLETVDRNRNINPSNTADVIGEFARGTAADVHHAIAVAGEAFKTWSRTTPQQRFDVLDRAGTEVIGRKEELGRLLAREQGKPLADGMRGKGKIVQDIWQGAARCESQLLQIGMQN